MLASISNSCKLVKKKEQKKKQTKFFTIYRKHDILIDLPDIVHGRSETNEKTNIVFGVLYRSGMEMASKKRDVRIQFQLWIQVHFFACNLSIFNVARHSSSESEQSSFFICYFSTVVKRWITLDKHFVRVEKATYYSSSFFTNWKFQRLTFHQKVMSQLCLLTVRIKRGFAM